MDNPFPLFNILRKRILGLCKTDFKNYYKYIYCSEITSGQFGYIQFSFNHFDVVYNNGPIFKRLI